MKISDELRKLFDLGLTNETINEVYADYIKEKKEKEEKQAAIDNAHEALVDAFMEYLEALNVINPEMSDDEINKYVTLIDTTVKAWGELFTKGKVTVSTSMPPAFAKFLFKQAEVMGQKS